MDLLPFETTFSPQKFNNLKRLGYMIDIEHVENYIAELKRNTSASPKKKFWEGKRVLITGVSGMVGSTMADLLVEMEAEVYGAIKRHAVPDYPNIRHLTEARKLKILEVDLRDYGRLANIMKEIQPEVIFHQAAESFVPTSMQQPTHVVENNCVSTVNLLEAATKEDRSLEGLQLACSSEQYGFIKSLDELPIKETNELRPTSTYAATKVFTEYIGKSYFYSYTTPVLITRTFNQEGPRRGPQFFTSRVAFQVSECLEGRSGKIVIGNPNSVRDFIHVHDSAKAQMIAVEKCNRGEAYNICSGVGITTGDYVKLAIGTFGLSKVKLFVDRSLLRPYERGEKLMDGFIGDNTKFVKKTGWRPKKSVLDIIRDSTDYYKKMRR